METAAAVGEGSRVSAEALEREPNNRKENAQRVAVPVIVNAPRSREGLDRHPLFAALIGYPFVVEPVFSARDTTSSASRSAGRRSTHPCSRA